VTQNKQWRLPYGDTTEADEREFRKLTFLFNTFTKTRTNMEKRVQARCLIIFAHKYLMLGIEEAADEYFAEAERICPRYFEDYLTEDMDKFLEFDKACRDMAEWYQEKFKI